MTPELLVKKVSKEQNFSISTKAMIKPNQQYKVSTNITPHQGKPYSAFFVIAAMDSSNNIISRYYRWIKDFSQSQKDLSIIFTSPPNSKLAVLRFVINDNAPVRSYVVVELPNLSKINFEETQGLKDSFENFEDCIVSNMETLTESDEEILERKIVWIIGSARSGTTWLSRDLLNCPENYFWNEPKIIHSIKPQITDNPKSFFSPHYKNIWSVYLRKLLLARIYAHTQSLKQNVIIKEPLDEDEPEIVMLCLPKSKFIFLVRDGRDIVDSKVDVHKPNSWLRKKGGRPEVLNSEESRKRAIRSYSKTWNITMSNIKKAFSKHDPQLRIEIKYENLLSNTFLELKKIYKFLGISIEDNRIKKIIEKSSFEKIPDSMKGPGKIYRSALPGNWKKNFTATEREIMNNIMEKTLKEFGYEKS